MIPARLVETPNILLRNLSVREHTLINEHLKVLLTHPTSSTTITTLFPVKNDRNRKREHYTTFSRARSVPSDGSEHRAEAAPPSCAPNPAAPHPAVPAAHLEHSRCPWWVAPLSMVLKRAAQRLGAPSVSWDRSRSCTPNVRNAHVARQEEQHSCRCSKDPAR